MTATIIKFPKHTGSPIRAVNPIDEALCLLRIAELRAGVVSAEATAEDLERLHDAVLDYIAEQNGGVR